MLLLAECTVAVGRPCPGFTWCGLFGWCLLCGGLLGCWGCWCRCLHVLGHKCQQQAPSQTADKSGRLTGEQSLSCHEELVFSVPCRPAWQGLDARWARALQIVMEHPTDCCSMPRCSQARGCSQHVLHLKGDVSSTKAARFCESIAGLPMSTTSHSVGTHGSLHSLDWHCCLLGGSLLNSWLLGTLGNHLCCECREELDGTGVDSMQHWNIEQQVSG